VTLSRVEFIDFFLAAAKNVPCVFTRRRLCLICVRLFLCYVLFPAQVTVLRESQKKQVSCHDLVVGDIVILSTGDIVSADGYCIDGASRNDLSINEKMLTGETVMKKKGEYQFSADGKSVLRSPIIFSGTFVQDGEGRMIVLAVGTSTYQGSMQQKMIEADAEKSRSGIVLPSSHESLLFSLVYFFSHSCSHIEATCRVEGG
jgi:P-type E1-E2 ATPase